MRLHQLEVSAFGPFQDQVAVDLDALGGDGLFLLHGDTGAGKTTLLDAIAFALYGRVPGPRNDAKRLRCDRSDPSTPTFVRLQATLGGHRVEITRSPAYLRPKARGTGLTEEKHKVVLRWMDAPPTGFRSQGLTRAEEVGQTVIDLLGMSADQFFQVVLLPQGEFARFLRSDTAEREVLLERLFDTGRFGSVEDWFQSARRESAAAVRGMQATAGELLARVAEAANQPAGPAIGDATSWLADLRDRLADQADLAAGEQAAARNRRGRAEADLRATQTTADRLDRVRRLRSRREELRRTAPEREVWLHSITAHAAAQPVVASAVAARVAADDVTRCGAEVDRLRMIAVTLLPSPDEVPKTAADLRVLSALVRDRAGGLSGLITETDRQRTDVAALADARSAEQRAAGRLAELDDVLAHLPGLVASASVREAKARAAFERLPGVRARSAASAEVLAAARSVVTLSADERAATVAMVWAVDVHQAAVDERQLLVERRIAGMAAELAAGLTPGASCPVCGATEHPGPAVPSGPPATAEQIGLAERVQEAAKAARERAVAARDLVVRSLIQAETAAAGRSPDEALQEFEACSLASDQESAAADGLPGAAKAHRDAAAALDSAATTRQRIVVDLAEATAVKTALQATVAAREQRLEAGRGSFPDVPSRRQHLLDTATGLESLASATESLDGAEVSLAQSDQDLQARIAVSGFGTVSEANAAASIDRNGIAARLRAAEDELTVIDSQLADPELSGVDPGLEVDLAAAHRVVEQARAAAESALTMESTTSRRRDQVAVAARNLLAVWRELEPVLAADAELAALTDVVLGKGQNARGMSLRTYVLANKLSHIAIAGGHRLSAMSGGRYSFVQSTEREARGRSGGLGLDILDAHSGLVRPAKTLSGGESFLASLALALGLADVVAAEAGGRQLDTMFIDEGFGSLDADTLDMVMGTLDELRAGGRTVGLVSHVEELRQRIPMRLCIRRTPAGSTLELSGR